MKILYGVQGTGNGHISRAREMSKSLRAKEIEVDYLFSGRDINQYFDMDDFGDCRIYKGLTFYSKDGRLSYVKTATSNNIYQFLKDVFSLRLDKYDLVISDFEPITAWAGKSKKINVIGIGHQYAFDHQIPRAGNNFISNLTMRYFAPTSLSLGLHWSSFDSRILPPIVDTNLKRNTERNNAVVVYLPFENQVYIQDMLRKLPDQHFIIYSPDLENQETANLSLRKTSHAKFKFDLCQAKAVICNSGFELISECLQLGLAILTKPQMGQTEQMSNAAALSHLGLARCCQKISESEIQQWLDDLSKPEVIDFPNVADAITAWLLEKPRSSPQQLSDELWAKVTKGQQSTEDNRLPNTA